MTEQLQKNETNKVEESSDDNVCKDAIDSFDNMGLSDNLLRGIYSYGFEKPSGIQQLAIKPFTSGRDMIAQAQSGTGKSGCFIIGALAQIRPEKQACQVIILAPTRELAQQTLRVVDGISTYLNIKTHACVGGTRVADDIAKLRNGVHVVCGTPGRVYDMLYRRQLQVGAMKTLIVDEADEMMSRGFRDQLYELIQLLPADIQIGLFSATMPPDALDMAKKVLRNPMRVLVKQDELTLEGIRQYYVAIEHDDQKLDTLCDLYSSLNVTQCVIFVNSRRRVDWLADQMNKRQFTVSATHGDMSQKDREVVLSEFRTGSSRVLITTDLLARGIDVQQVNVCILYDLGKNPDTYIHKVGRSGRFGRKGVAINFVTPEDVETLRDIERYYSTTVEELPGNIKDVI